MAYHPDLLVNWNASQKVGGSATNVRYARSGKRYAAAQRTGHKRSWQIELKPLSYTDAMSFVSFVEARYGSYDPFYWFSWYPTSRTAQFVAFGDGAATVFNLPFKAASVPPLIYVNAVLKTGGGVDYTYAANAGTGGEDKVTFTSAVGNGDTITATFTLARERHFVAFVGDEPEGIPSYGDGAIRLQFRYTLEEVL